jgi:hypothetical protein
MQNVAGDENETYTPEIAPGLANKEDRVAMQSVAGENGEKSS